jgi:chromosome segregation ATPase
MDHDAFLDRALANITAMQQRHTKKLEAIEADISELQAHQAETREKMPTIRAGVFTLNKNLDGLLNRIRKDREERVRRRDSGDRNKSTNGEKVSSETTESLATLSVSSGRSAPRERRISAVEQRGLLKECTEWELLEDDIEGTVSRSSTGGNV